MLAMKMNGSIPKPKFLEYFFIFLRVGDDARHADKVAVFFPSKLDRVVSKRRDNFLCSRKKVRIDDRPVMPCEKCSAASSDLRHRDDRNKLTALIRAEPLQLIAHALFKFSPVPRIEKRRRLYPPQEAFQLCDPINFLYFHNIL